MAAERAVLASELQGLEVEVPELVIGGRPHRRVLRSTETYLSGVGPITVQRTLYRAGSEPAVVALELRAGIVAGHWTPLAARQASVLVAHMRPQESVDTACAKLGNMSPSGSSLDRLPKHLSSRWEQEREGFEDALRAATREVPAEAATLAVSRRWRRCWHSGRIWKWSCWPTARARTGAFWTTWRRRQPAA